MTNANYKEKLRQEFISTAQQVFERVMEASERERLSLSEMEERVGELKFELTRKLLESWVEMAVQQQGGPGPVDEESGEELEYKGLKELKERVVVTSQGEIKVKRPYYYDRRKGEGFFPPG
jgi:hypothetical protein